MRYLIIITSLFLLLSCKEEKQLELYVESLSCAETLNEQSIVGDWVLMYRQEIVEGKVLEHYQTDEYSIMMHVPAVMEVGENDSIYGRHDANHFWGAFNLRDTNRIEVTFLTSTDAMSNNWFRDFQKGLTEVITFEVCDDGTLRLFDSDEKQWAMVFLEKKRFNQAYFDVDSLYNR